MAMTTKKEREQFGMGGHYCIHIDGAEERVQMMLNAMFFERSEEDGGLLKDNEIYFEPNRPPVLLPEYEDIYDWIGDNKGQGLLMQGGSGTGKTMFARTIIPAFVREHYHKVMTYCTARELDERKDEVLGKRLVVIDDIGTEDAVGNDYGTRRLLFPQIVDDISQKGGLLVVTTNLTQEELQRKYGFRTFDRLTRMCRIVTFTGESLRNCPTWDELPQDLYDFWNEQGRRYREWSKVRVAYMQGTSGHEVYMQELERWYEKCANECGMTVEDWREWKTSNEKYLRTLWEKAKRNGEKTSVFEWWLRGKNLWRDDFGEVQNISDTAAKAIKTPQISKVIPRVVKCTPREFYALRMKFSRETKK